MINKVYVACNFNCPIETERLVKVTGSYMHCTCGNMLETVQDRDVVQGSYRH